MKERVASIRDIDGTDPTVRCILCALNMGYGLDDRRFTEGIFEEQTKGMSDVGRRRILIIAAGSSGGAAIRRRLQSSQSGP